MVNINQTPYDENGNRHGKWVLYYINGQIWYHQNYIHGIIHGLIEGYDYNGTLWFRGYRNMGRRIGHWYDLNKKFYYLSLI